MKKHKILFSILVVIIAIVIICFGVRNDKVINNNIDEGLSLLQEDYKLTQIPNDEYDTITLYGIMKFHISQYDVEGLGNLCIMKTNIGIMQMFTFVLTPYEKQMPLLSIDYMYTLNKRTAIIEYFDLVPDTENEEYKNVLANLKTVMDGYQNLDDDEKESAWYDELETVATRKVGTSSKEKSFSSLFSDSIKAYVDSSSKLSILSETDQIEKHQIIQNYCDTLIEKGGFSTNIFKKELGEDGTRDFFNEVLYCTIEQ